jgi:hypothetical protein
MTVIGIVVSLALLCLPFDALAQASVVFSKKNLNQRLLLQVSYEREAGQQNFMNTRSRIVEFQRDGKSLRMVEEARDSSPSPHVLATIPIRGETDGALLVDFNAGFDKIFKEEDRTGEDYYGRLDTKDYSFFALLHRTMLSVSRQGSM